MPIQLGEDPLILIALIFLELLLILIPALIAGKIEHKSVKEELNEMGFQKRNYPLNRILIEVFAGLGVGLFFFLISGYILFFFRNIIVENLFGTIFIKQGQEGSISSEPLQPTLIQLIIIIILQIIIVGPCEEGFFRGFVIKKYESKMRTIIAVLISSIFFSFYHVPPILVPLETIITYFGYYFIFGILLALLFKCFNNSLIPCTVAHCFFNILIILF